MKFGWTNHVMTALAVLVASAGANADTTPVAAATAPAPAATTLTAPVAAPASAGSLIGILDLRPSVQAADGGLYSENTLEVGYKFDKTVAVSFAQFFNTNLLDKSPGTTGINLTLPGAFIRTRLSKLYTNGDFNFGMQNRIYLPYTQAERNNGKVASIRQYLTFSQKLSNVFTVTAMEIPILHVYTRAGTGSAAMPIFENRVYLITDINITDKLSLSLPVMFHVTKYRNFVAGAKNNSATTYFMWINPELGYAINDNLSVGVGYYSDNLVKSDLSGMDVSAGLKAGIAQAFVTMNL